MRNSHSPLLKLSGAWRAATSTPNTLPSTSIGTATIARKPTLRQPLRERRIDQARVRLVDQLPEHGLGHAVVADVHMLLFGERQFHRQLGAAQAHARDHHVVGRRVVQADAAEIDGHLVFERADHDLEDARQVLAFADGARDLVQQAHALDLRAQLALGSFALGDVVEQDGDLAALRAAHPVGADLVEAAQRLGFVFEAQRLAGQRDFSVDVEPVLFMVRREFAHALALRIAQAGLAFERGIDLEEAVVHGLAVVIEDHFDGAEPFDEGVEQLAISGFRLSVLCHLDRG